MWGLYNQQRQKRLFAILKAMDKLSMYFSHIQSIMNQEL